jgi:hypothetical protein
VSNLLVDVKAKVAMEVEIDAEDAFRILCKSLAMGFVLDEDTDYQIRKDEYGKNGVYVPKNGLYYKLDSRGDLFVALRNVAVICISVMKNTYGMIVRRDEDERDLQKL